MDFYYVHLCSSKILGVRDHVWEKAAWSPECLPSGWTDDLVKTAASHWMQVASDRSRWKSIGDRIFSSGQQQADMLMTQLKVIKNI